MKKGIKVNRTLRFSEDLGGGYQLELHGDCLKARVTKEGDLIIGLSTSLKYYFDTHKSTGFITQKERTKKECIILAEKWAIKNEYGDL